MEVYFSGTIERIIFENVSNFYRILLLDIQDTNAEDFDDFEIIVTGTMADVIEGEEYTFWGQIVQHSKYGEQLQISRYERAKPTSKGLVKYFSSSHFKGIGLKTAQKIVDTYGENTIDEILEHPEKLESIAGLSAKNREATTAFPINWPFRFKTFTRTKRWILSKTIPINWLRISRVWASPLLTN